MSGIARLVNETMVRNVTRFCQITLERQYVYTLSKSTSLIKMGRSINLYALEELYRICQVYNPFS